MNKVYISNVDTPLGYHLVDLLRNDHHNHISPISIVGSAETGQQDIPHVYQTVNFAVQSQIALRAILDCDLVVLNLDFDSHQAEVIIKFLQKSNASFLKPLRVIGLSSLMTWQGLKAFQIQKQTEKQKLMSAILDENSWKRITWTQKDFQKRIPNNFYVKTHQLQNILIKMNKFSKINATVVATGLLYGKQNLFLQHQILQSLGGSSLDIIGNGDNLISLTNYQSLLDCIECLIPKQKVPYAIVCDKTQYTQKQIKQLINQVTANSAPLLFKQCLYLSKKECDWTINLTIQPSPQLTHLFQKKNFQNYIRKQLLQDFCDYNCFKPKQYLVITDKFEQNSLKELTQQLRLKITVILQQDLDKYNQQMVSKMSPVEIDTSNKKKNKNSLAKPSSSQKQRQNVVYYAQAFQHYLKDKKYHNFVVICNLTTYSFLKKGLTFGSLTQIIQDQPEEAVQDQILYQSDQYYQQFALAKPSDIIKELQNCSKEENRVEQIYQSQKPIRKDEHLILLNQYLLDKVLLPISEAKFALKIASKQLNLGNFITQLKDILNRTNNKSSRQLVNQTE